MVLSSIKTYNNSSSMKESVIPPINSIEPIQVAPDNVGSHGIRTKNHTKIQSIENMAPILEQLEILANSG